MLAVISNQHLTKNNIRRKAEKCKTAHSSPPDYETRNIVSTSDGVSCAENDEKNRIQKKDTKLDITTGRKIVKNYTARFWTISAVCFRKKKRTKKKNAKGRLTDVKKNKK